MTVYDPYLAQCPGLSHLASPPRVKSLVSSVPSYVWLQQIFVIRWVGGFFDCLNVRSLNEHKTKKKPFLKTYTSQHNERLSWLKNDFLGYIDEWKKSINERPGDFTSGQKEKMFISNQTYIGLKTAVAYVKHAL